jgi:hypothetical protein
MPEISRFYGISIKMFHGDHPPPHFHAEHGGMEVTKIAPLAVNSLFRHDTPRTGLAGCPRPVADPVIAITARRR